MTFDQVYETIPGDGWLSKVEAKLLWDEARRTVGTILEVGCYKGRSTCLLAALGRVVIAVDPFAGFDFDDVYGENAEAAFKANLAERKLTNVVLIKRRVEDWNAVQLRVGFAHLDGDHTHSGTLAQIDKALVCKPQTVAIHDVNDSGGGLEVKRASLERLGPWTARVERLAVWRLQ